MTGPTRRETLKIMGAGLAMAGTPGLAATQARAGLPPPKLVNTNGVQLSVHDAGSGPTILLLHGWPEIAYTWRFVMPTLVAAGYRVLAPDLRGFGRSSAPAGVERYDIAQLQADVTGLLDALGIPKATVVGHDWGGILAWHLALAVPDRLDGVVGVNTPFFPRLPFEPVAFLRRTFGERMYVVQIQEMGPVDDLLSRNAERFFRSQMRSGAITVEQFARLPIEAKDFDFLSQFRKPPPPSLPGRRLLGAEDLATYVSSFRRTGFTPGLNWYRNLDRNWALIRGLPQRVEVPALMVCAKDDVVLPPSLTDGMEAFVPELKRVVLEDCGHWTPQEKPRELSAAILAWMKERRA